MYQHLHNGNLEIGQKVVKQYDFKNGYSRSKSSSTDSDERNEEPEKKRKKIMTAERLQEIESISEVLKGTTDQIATRSQRLERPNMQTSLLCRPIEFKGCGPFSRKTKL